MDAAIAIAREAAAVALEAQASAVEERKGDDSPVSHADRACDAAIRGGIAARFPGDAILSEETDDDLDRLDRARVWIVDPIDGTRGFLDGDDAWAIHVGFAVDGRLVLGVVAAPARGWCYAGVPEAGAWEVADDGRRIPVEPASHDPVLLCSHRMRRRADPALEPFADLEREYRHSVGYKACLLLRGEGTCYLHPQTIHEWDAAAPAALVSGAGGIACTAGGDELTFNHRDPRVPGIFLACGARAAEMRARLDGDAA